MNEFRRDGAWRVVLAACVGAAFGLTALPFYTLGVFAKPLAAEFAWSRSTIQSAITFAMFGVVSGAWLAGWLIDHYGARRVALCSQVGLAVGFLGLTLQTGAPWLWQANWFVCALLGVGTTPLTWTRGIASWFVQRRGLAIGIALAGTGITALVAPPLVSAIVAAHGWRTGYVAIALGIVGLALPMVWFFFREKRPDAAARQSTSSTATTDGMTLAQALRHPHFWLLVAAFAGIASAIAGVIPNLIPMLTDGGLTPAEAARYASLLGLNVMLGRLIAGWLLDRYWAPAVAVALLMPPVAACLLLASHQWPALAVALVGLAGGAEFDLIAYLCLRYFGTRNFGQIYGWQWASFSLCAGFGPLAFGRIFDSTGSYQTALWVAAALLVVGPLLLLALGRYPQPGAYQRRGVST